MFLKELIGVPVGFNDLRPVLQVRYLLFQLHNELLLFLLLVELFQVAQVFFALPDLGVVALVIKLLLQFDVRIVSVVQDLVPNLLVDSENRQLLLFHDGNTSYSVHLLHLVAELFLILSFVLEESFIRVLVVESRTRLL